MIQRRVRDYEVSLWSLQDSLLAILKQYGLEFKGQIQDPKLTDKDDGTQQFTFSVPMYLMKGSERIENPSWYSVKNGALLMNMRKIKVIFNKDKPDFKVYEFLITKVSLRHDAGELYCDIECEGLAFHELGKLGYKISLTAEDFYNDDYDWYTNGEWKDGYGNIRKELPLATLQYWNDKVFSTVLNWTYEIHMNWDSYSSEVFLLLGNINNEDFTDDIVTGIRQRASNKVYEDDFVDSWKNDDLTGKLIPAHVTTTREKARVGININESNIYNITQTLAETFGVFCKYVYGYDQNFHIVSRKVIYYNNFFNELYGKIDINYSYNTSSIVRDIDSTDLVTKLYVKSVENSASAAGLTSIIDVGANQSQEDYILNFDYLYKIGGITLDQYNAITEYIQNIREINLKLSPLSAKVISLLSELPKLEAEKATRVNSRAKAIEQVDNAQKLLNNLTQGTGILMVTSSNPQTAVLIKDTSKSYDSYYIKLTQKGIYPLTIKIYRSYSYNQSQLSDQVTTGIVEFDDYGEVVRVSSLYLLPNSSSKTVYVTYDYSPDLYYERVRNVWKARLALDEAGLAAVNKQLAYIKYNLYGTNDLDYTLSEIEMNNIPESETNIKKQYNLCLDEKKTLIKDFNTLMGPALRLGYWQPDDYADYGDKYTDTLKVGETYFDTSPYLGSTGNSAFYWDKLLFDNLQKLYYEYSGAQTKIAYPCIDLSKRPDLVKFIQDHIDLPISFYYKPITSLLSDPRARKVPAVRSSPEELVLVKNLYTYNSITNKIGLSSNVVNQYELDAKDMVNYYPQILLQKWLDGSYKIGYTYFYWLARRPRDNNEYSDWFKITDKRENSAYLKLEDRYSFYVLSLYKDNVRFINLDGSSSNYQLNAIQLFSTNTCSFDNWLFRLVIGNNKGINLKTNETTGLRLWYNEGYNVVPTRIKTYVNLLLLLPQGATLNNGVIPDNDLWTEVTFSFKVIGVPDKMTSYAFKYIAGNKSSSSGGFNYSNWESGNESYSNWSNINTTSPIVLVLLSPDLSNVKNNDILTWRLNIKNLSADSPESEWRFKLVANDIYNCINSNEHRSQICRLFGAATNPYYLGNEIQGYALYKEGQERYASVKIKYTIASVIRNNENLYDQYCVENITWYKVKNGASAQQITNGEDYAEIINSEVADNPGHFITELKITLPTLATSSKITEVSSDWDGYYVYPIIINKKGDTLRDIDPNQLQQLAQIDICYPIIISLLESYILNIDIPTQDFTVSFNIDTQYAQYYEWTITKADTTSLIFTNSENGDNNTIISHSLTNNQVNLTFNFKGLNNANFDLLETAQFNDCIISCKIWNTSHNFYSTDEDLAYQKISNLQLFINPPITFMEQIDNYISIDYWPSGKNEDKIIYTLPIMITNLFNEGLSIVKDTRINTELIPSRCFYVNNDENELEWLLDLNYPSTTSNLLELRDKKNYKDRINNQYLYNIDFSINSGTNLNKYTYDNSPFINITNENNDNKYYYFYKYIIRYNFSENMNPLLQIIYIRVNIRQCKPIFKENSYWKPSSNNASEIGLDTRCGDYIPYNGVFPFLSDTKCTRTMYDGNTTWTLLANDFDFIANSVNLYTWYGGTASVQESQDSATASQKTGEQYTINRSWVGWNSTQRFDIPGVVTSVWQSTGHHGLAAHLCLKAKNAWGTTTTIKWAPSWYFYKNGNIWYLLQYARLQVNTHLKGYFYKSLLDERYYTVKQPNEGGN